MCVLNVDKDMKYDTVTQVLYASIFIPKWPEISKHNAAGRDFIFIADI